MFPFHFLASSDYVAVDANMTVMSGFSKCFQIQLINDEISEHVEAFRLQLDTVLPGDDLTFVNKSLTVVIMDDGMLVHDCYLQAAKAMYHLCLYEATIIMYPP